MEQVSDRQARHNHVKLMAQQACVAHYLLSDIELTLAVEHGLQRHTAHPISQKYRKVLRPASQIRDSSRSKGSFSCFVFPAKAVQCRVEQHIAFCWVRLLTREH